PLLDQVQKRNPETAIPLGDRDDEPEVRLDHPPLRQRIALLDALRERDLLGGRQQLVAARGGGEELQAVRRSPWRPGRGVRGLDRRLRPRLLGLDALRRANLQSKRLQLARELLDLVLVEVVLERKGLQLRRLDEAALLGTLDQRARLLGLEKLVQLL